MTDELFTTLGATGLLVALLHAALPTHWLPFALTARAQRWSAAQTAMVTVIASTAHVLSTAVIGGLVFWAGIELSEEAHEIFHWVAGGLLVGLGIYFLVRQFLGKGHGHFHLLGKHGEEVHDHDYDEHCIDRELQERRTRRMSVGGLILMLTLSPCESFFGVYLSAASYGWSGFLYLTLILLAGTVGAMVILSTLASAGINRFNLGRLERYENGILGTLLVILGVAFVLWLH